MASDPLVGALLSERYRLDELIGSGGMGRVFRGHHVVLDRTVAVKVLHAHLAADSEFRARFLREPRLAGQLKHPHIIPVHDASDDSAQPYVVMDYVAGGDLRSVLRRGGPLGLERTLAILRQVADALDAAHDKGMVHRDIKPANVLLADGDHAFLTDFGLAKQASAAGDATKTGVFMGTPYYAAPEQFEGREVGPAADVYALACVLFECLSGSAPFDYESEFRLYRAHLEEPPPQLCERRPELPEQLDDVIEKAMDKDPGRRFESAGALLDAATAALEESRLSATVIAPVGASRAEAPHDAPSEADSASSSSVRSTQTVSVPPTPAPSSPAPRAPRRAAGRRWITASAAIVARLGGSGILAVALLTSGSDDPAPTVAEPSMTAPAAPVSVDARPMGPTRVRLAWSPSPSGEVARYIIERQGAADARARRIGTAAAMPGTSLSRVDGGLAPGSRYVYRVAAQDAAGNTSGWETVVVTTPSDFPRPAERLLARAVGMDIRRCVRGDAGPSSRVGGLTSVTAISCIDGGRRATHARFSSASAAASAYRREVDGLRPSRAGCNGLPSPSSYERRGRSAGTVSCYFDGGGVARIVWLDRTARTVALASVRRRAAETSSEAMRRLLVWWQSDGRELPSPPSQPDPQPEPTSPPPPPAPPPTASDPCDPLSDSYDPLNSNCP